MNTIYKCPSCKHTVTRETKTIGTLYCSICDVLGFPVAMEAITEAKMTTEQALRRAITLLNCAQADLQGEIDYIDPEGNHPARKTIEEITEFIKNLEGE